MSDRRKLTELLVDLTHAEGKERREKEVELREGVEFYKSKYKEAWTPYFEK